MSMIFTILLAITVLGLFQAQTYTRRNAAGAGSTTNTTSRQRSAASTVTLKIKPLHIPVENLGQRVTEEDGFIAMPVSKLVLNESFQSNYTPEFVYGRMDPIAIFKNVQRSVTFSFELITSAGAYGPDQVSMDVNKLNAFVKSLYPVYTPEIGNSSILKSPPFFRIKYSNVVGGFVSSEAPAAGTMSSGGNNGLTGYITNFKINLGDVPQQFTVGAQGQLLPMMYNVGFTLNVVHDHKVGWYDNKFGGDDSHSQFPYNSGAPVTIQEGTNEAGAANSPRPTDPLNPRILAEEAEAIKIFEGMG